MADDYVVRDPQGAARAVFGLLITLLVLEGVALWLSGRDHDQSPMLPFLLAAAAVVVTVLRVRGAHLLRVSAYGVALPAGDVPWQDISKVKVSSQRLVLVLRQGASLPSRMRARIVDPDNPGIGAELETGFASRHDPGVYGAVQRHAPVGTVVTSP